ncbi:MAG TPA: CHAT domain-containing protein [Thermoanaerobaculia bacterium]|nr:CHAT domain-containing protein [Thermoanaerobaculia bacterium]
MKKPALIVLALCLSLCSRKDTTGPEVWRRPVEPRITGATEWQACQAYTPAGHVVAMTECGTPPQESDSNPCPNAPSTRAAALRLLSDRPRCLDLSVAALERFAMKDAAAKSDLAAAYYVRAQRDDQPNDLLLAMDAIEESYAGAPHTEELLFNRALIQESLGFTSAAMESWLAVQKISRGEWAREARHHIDRLSRERRFDAAVQWPLIRPQLDSALVKGDRAAVARFVDPLPGTATAYFETVAGRWAKDPTAERTAQLQLFGDELSRRLDDPYARDVAAHIAAAKGADRDRLMAALDTYTAAVTTSKSLDYDRGLPAKAASLLRRAGSPLALAADLSLATAVSLSDAPRALAMLDALQKESESHHYDRLVSRVHATRAWILAYQGRLADALAESAVAEEIALRIGDREGAASYGVRRIGYARAAGQLDTSAREVLRGVRSLPLMTTDRDRNFTLGDTAGTALELGHPQIALLYQEMIVDNWRSILRRQSPIALSEVSGIQKQLSIALRERAAIENRLGRDQAAIADLDEAIRLGDADGNAAIVRTLLRARAEEIKGRSLLKNDPRGAIGAYTRALQLAVNDTYPTFRASLHAQRAAAHRLLGHKADAERDLRAALAEVHNEELAAVSHRENDTYGFWAPYFSRFQETYQQLIRYLVEDRRTDEAFAYAERARAFELLDLVGRKQNGVTAPATLGAIRTLLPAGTYLIEYSVLDDRTYAWIASRDTSSLLQLRATAADVRQWTDGLRRATALRPSNAALFESQLSAPHRGLIAEPLRAIRALAGNSVLNVVIIPDGAMHGLPFAALRDGSTGRYVIEDAIVSVAPSAALYAISLQRDAALPRDPRPTVLLIGDPRFDRTLDVARGLPRLPGAQREVTKIAAIYGHSAEVRRNEEATVPDFMQRARDRSVIHIAAHAVTNPRVPSSSLVLLAPSTNDSGVLEARALLNDITLPRARLFVFSACSTAGGMPVGPEGVTPLVRPIIAAGVPGVIGGLWDIEDATVDELLVSFHEHYREGSNAAAAMQAAQLQMLGSNSYLKSPLYWGAFQVIGYASSPFAGAHENREGDKPP